MKSKATLVGLCLLFLTGLFAGSAWTQGLFGTISGTVTDPGGGVIPNATVTVTNINTNVKVTVQTNGSGDYSVPSLIPGTYKVEASAQGFKTALQTNVVLRVDANPKVSLKLEIGSASETVTVTGEGALLQTQESSLSTTVDERQLDQLPVSGGSGHSPYNLVQLSPSVTQQTGEGGYALDNARMSGGRPRMDDYLVDGTSTEQPTFGGPAVTPSVDSVQEFKVQTNSFSAEFGKVSGGVIELTTKSGTNTFHGSAYLYYQTSKLNANSYFSNAAGIPIQPSHYDEFGGTIGGPIVRDKLFFFTDYQGVRASTSSTISGDIVPNAAFRSGDLSSICTAGFSAGICNNPTQQLYAPNGGAPYLNNQVPVSPIAQKLEAMFPQGNGGASSLTGGDLWNGIRVNGTEVNRFNPRVDWFLGQKDHVFGILHYQHERYPWDTLGWAAEGGYSTNPDTSITAGWSHTFGSNLINEFHFGYNHRSPIRTTNGYGQVSDSDFGISGIPACNYPGSNGKCGAPTVGISGFAGFGAGGGMLIEPAGQIEFLDTLTKIIGAHTFKLGGEIRRGSIDNIQPNSLTGNFSFNGKGTGNPFADFLIGYMGTPGSVQVQQNYLEVRTWADALFLQDDWKVTQKLTLNLGLRWQYDPSWTENHHQLASFDPYNLTWIQNGLNGAPEGSIDTHWKEFGPRIGFAWNPWRGFVVHGGYGITFPGVFGHGRGGDGNPSPNLLTNTQIPAGTYIDNLPPIATPSNGPLQLWQGEYSTYTPRKQGTVYSELWNLTLEQQVGRNGVATLAYSGSHGVHLPVNYAYNLCQQSYSNILKYGNTIYNGTIDSPYCAPGNITALGGFYGDYVYPGYWGLSSSVYHSLQASFEKRYSQNLALQTSFTWSKLIDDSSSDWSGFGALDQQGQNFYDRASERSVSAGDIPLRFIFSPIYDLPVGPGHRLLNHGIAGQVLGGFRVSGIYVLQAGDPVGINDGGYLYCNPAMTIATRPMQVGDPRLRSGQNIQHWFNTNAFDWSGTCAYYSNLRDDSGNPYQGDPKLSFGNTPRYSADIRGPRYDNLDASLQKEFSLPFLGDQGRLRLQFDGFNILNHPEFLPPVGIASPQFGQILGTRNNGRAVQLGAHLAF